MRYLLFAIVLVSCLSPRKADRQLSKISDKFPEKISSLCADSFKIVEKIDTATLVEYDWIELEPEVKFDVSKDNIVKYTTKYKVQYRTITITKNVENTARVKELSDKLDKCDSLYKKSVAQTQRYKGYTKILSLLLALLVITFYFVLKRKK